MSYALITGASSGMGLCYAKELARMGYNIIAVSNQPAELEAVAASLRTEYAIEAHAIYADLAERSAAKMLFDRCQSEGWEVEILISNAGMLLFSTLTNTAPERLATIIDLHCTTTTLLCRYFGEAMKQRGKGLFEELRLCAMVRTAPLWRKRNCPIPRCGKHPILQALRQDAQSPIFARRADAP